LPCGFECGEFVLNVMVLRKQNGRVHEAAQFRGVRREFPRNRYWADLRSRIVMVWSYALVRPRLGPGVRPAAIVGLIAWFGIYVYVGIINAVLFAVPMNLMAIALVWGFVEFSWPQLSAHGATRKLKPRLRLFWPNFLAVIICSQVVTLGASRDRGSAASCVELSIIEDGAFAGARRSAFERAGHTPEIEALIQSDSEVIDAGGRVLMPVS